MDKYRRRTEHICSWEAQKEAETGTGKVLWKRGVYTIKEAMEILKQQEASRLIDNDKVKEEAIKRTENSGIVFLDELFLKIFNCFNITS